ncbi:addiction module antitoxin [Burkholderia gladioli pv. gladioli]|uniref:Addiction module antidote protein, family n=1 Tax=Burkholderia gladioli TaxID=28095 RepID=A0A095F3U0_BURGA|nr:hypothetical protein [Burkholderia gladioli]AJW98377.1 addiction module antidote protein, family [Burkholderia gladioli]ASD79814.1 addiction module antitoxin [Burkholderia gladioli pv. gladioli]AWY54941.1 addiction module antitoxin [Burkholderia gladioli pv. gladioli]KGC11605.1 addiction module antidote protein, family [Burkholderia gladioli]MDJ1164062.1 addiction module antitoxin [Burkholderia gladioli pv. gladioli]
MSRAAATTITVRPKSRLSNFAAENVGEIDAYENVSEYVRDQILRHNELNEADAFDRLRAELGHAYAAPESSYTPLTAADVIARNRS